MSRWSEQEWLNDFDAKDLARARKNIETCGFWAYVDSRANAYSHPGECETRVHPYLGERVICTDWRHRRGTDGNCLAARSDLTQCAQPALEGTPFCDFHFDRAWTAMCAFVADDRVQHVAHQAEWEKGRILNEAGIEIAEARDARRTLAAQPERVYFFAADDFVKIGRSVHPERRVRSLRGTLAPDGVDIRTGNLLGTIPGGCEVEHHLHTKYRRHRVKGEWFHLAPLRDEIAQLLERDQFANSA